MPAAPAKPPGLLARRDPIFGTLLRPAHVWIERIEWARQGAPGEFANIEIRRSRAQKQDMPFGDVLQLRMQVAQLHDIDLVRDRIDAHGRHMRRRGDANRQLVKSSDDRTKPKTSPAALRQTIRLEAFEPQSVVEGFDDCGRASLRRY